jgi:hypothetical protein
MSAVATRFTFTWESEHLPSQPLTNAVIEAMKNLAVMKDGPCLLHIEQAPAYLKKAESVVAVVRGQPDWWQRYEQVLLL